MPRRMLDGDIRKSASLSRVSIQAGHVFVLMMTLADDQGRCDGDLLTLRSELFPRRRDIEDSDVEGWVKELISEECIHRYEVRGEFYVHFPAWTDYQRLRTESKERHPSPDDTCSLCLAYADLAALQREARSVSEKREARGNSGEAPRSAASRREITRKKKAKGSRGGPSGKSDAPDELTDEQMTRLSNWAVKHKDPEVSACEPNLEFFAEQCLGHYRANGQRYKNWVSVVEQWIRNGCQKGWIKDGRPTRNHSGREVDGKGELQRAYEEHIALAGRGGPA